MSIVKKACAGCGGAAIGLGAAVHAPCLLIVIGMASGLSASAAIAANFYGSIAMIAAGSIGLVYGARKKSVAIVAAASLVTGAGAYMAWSHVTKPVNPDAVSVLQGAHLPLLQTEQMIRALCGTRRPA